MYKELKNILPDENKNRIYISEEFFDSVFDSDDEMVKSKCYGNIELTFHKYKDEFTNNMYAWVTKLDINSCGKHRDYWTRERDNKKYFIGDTISLH